MNILIWNVFHSVAVNKHRNIHMRILKIVSYTIVEENVKLCSTGRALQYTFPGGCFFLNLPKVVSESKQIASTAEFNIYCAEQRDPKYAHKSRKNLFE